MPVCLGGSVQGTLSLMTSAYRRHSLLRRDSGWNLQDFRFDRNMALRGFARQDNVPAFHYRNDGYKMWDIIELYTALHVAVM